MSSSKFEPPGPDARELLQSWMTINRAVAEGFRSKLGVLKKQHLDLFPEDLRGTASRNFDAAVTDLDANTAASRAQRAKRTLVKLTCYAHQAAKAA